MKNRFFFAALAALILSGCAAEPVIHDHFPYREDAWVMNYSGYDACLIHKNLAEFYPGQSLPREARGGAFFDATAVKVDLAPNGLERVTLKVEKVLSDPEGRLGKSVTVLSAIPAHGGISFEPLEKYRVFALRLRGHLYTWPPYAFDVRQGVPSDCYIRPGHFARRHRF